MHELVVQCKYYERVVEGGGGSYLDESGSPVEIQMQVTDFSKITELVVDIVFLRLFVETRDEDDPAFYSCTFQGALSTTTVPHP